MDDERRFDPAALDDFIWQLELFRQDCGRPGLREIARASARVARESRKQNLKLPELSLATLSNVMRRRRVGPPNWSWVACFVLTCRELAEASGLTVLPREVPMLLMEWNRRLQAVYLSADGSVPRNTGSTTTGPGDQPGAGLPGQPAEGSGPLDRERFNEPPSTGRPPGTRRAGPEPPLAAPVPYERPRVVQPAETGDPASPPGQGDRAGAEQPQPTAMRELINDYVGDVHGRLSLTTQRMFTKYGQHGVALLQAAESGDVHACYRLGVLLCLDGHPNESLAWLMRAESGGHADARRLIEHHAPRAAATQHAYGIGLAASVDGDRATAQLYLERAVRHGHGAAAFELGTLWMDDPATAVYWFSRAARCGHALGQWWADKVHEDARRRQAGHDQPPPSRPLPDPESRHPIQLPTLNDLIEQALRQDQP
jgi:hypothetical protein